MPNQGIAASFFLELAAVFNDNLGTGGPRAAADPLNGADHVHSLGNGTKDHVLAVQPEGSIQKTRFVPMVSMQKWKMQACGYVA